MAFIGNTPISVAFLTDTFSGNGSTTAFTMTVAPANTSSIIVAITGVLQDPSTYSVSGTTLTFSAAPPTGTSNISVRYLGIPASGVTTTAYRTVTDFTATAGQTSFSVPSYTIGYIDVYRNGVRLVSTDYTATTGTTVVLNNACTVGDAVVTESFYVSSVLNAIPATAGAISLTSATYLSGILPVANGGTGLSAVTYTMQVFTSSGVYTKPNNVKFIKVMVVGGGGGGGGAAANAGGFNSAATGGGGGGTAIELISASSVGATETVTIGAFGSGGTSGGNGSAGGTSSFGSHCSATGGSAGLGCPTISNTGQNTEGGATSTGGVGSGGSFNLTGGSGGFGFSFASPNRGIGGSGGASFLCAGPEGVQSSAISAAATQYGAGGSGGASLGNSPAVSGGNGAAGIIVVEEFY